MNLSITKERQMDNYRYFTKSVVIDCMVRTSIVAAEITGYNRTNYRGRTLDFGTFATLSDPVDYFAAAMNTELEHGTAGDAEGTDVTGDDPMKTAMIAAAHIKGVERGGKRPYKPFPDYYDWLWWMEKLHERALERPM